MNTTFLLSGGAGRIICAIPALEKYHYDNPDDDFKVLIYGWENLYHSHPILQNRTYDANMKGVFDLIIKDSKLVCPEPYHNHEYYNQRISLVDAFNREINDCVHQMSVFDNRLPRLYLHQNESDTAKRMIQQAKDRFKKDKFIVFQPYGSGIEIVEDKLIDKTGRSLHKEGFEYLVYLLREINAVVLYMGDIKYNTINDESVLLTAKDVPGVDLRFFMAMIENCDYFVGVDSVGQHMARSFDKLGTILMGSTFEMNVTYPGWFKTYRKKNFKPTYNPIRISPVDSDMVDRINYGIMDFSEVEIEEIFYIIKNDIDGNFSNFNGNI